MSEILSQFRDEQLPPSHVDIPRAVRVGRRQRRSQTVTAVAAVAVLVGAGTTIAVSSWRNMASAPPPQATQTAGPTPPMPGSCTAQRLPVPPGVSPMVAVTAADPTGRFVAGRPLTVELRDPAVLWDGGSASTIPLAGISPTIHDINASGIATGETDLDEEGVRAFVVRDGSATLLHGRDANALSINESGTIAGTVTADRRPAIWPSGVLEPERLQLAAGLSRAESIFIDDDGTIVAGMTGSAAPHGAAVLWDTDGTPLNLNPQLPTTLPDGGARAESVTVVGVRGGWIALGFGDDPAAPGHTPPTSSVLWNHRTGEIRWLISPGAANVHGWHAGMAPEGPVLDNGQGGLLSLPGLADVVYGPFTVTTLASLSDDGRTITGTVSGTGSDDNGDVIPVIWHCA